MTTHHDWRALERQFASSGAMSRAQLVATARTSLVMMYGVDLPAALAAMAFFARLVAFAAEYREQ